MYNMANSVTLLEKLNLNTCSIVEVYNMHLGMWEEENINRVFQVVSQQKIFIRLKGVFDCPRFERLSVAEVSLSPGRVSHKRRVSNAGFGEDDLPSPKRLHLGTSATSDSTSTPLPLSASNASTSALSLLSAVDTFPSFPSTATDTSTSTPFLLSAIDTSASTVLTSIDTSKSSPLLPLPVVNAPCSPTHTGQVLRWPGDMYTCDAANKICRVVKAIG